MYSDKTQLLCWLPSRLFRWDRSAAPWSFMLNVAWHVLEGLLMHVWTRTRHKFTVPHVVVHTVLVSSVISTYTVFRTFRRMFTQTVTGALFCDVTDDLMNSLCINRWSYVLRVPASLDASSRCASSVKCAPLWEESLSRSTLRWTTSHTSSRADTFELRFLDDLCGSSGERGAAHHPVDVPILQEDDGLFLPWKKCWGGGGHWWGRQVPIGYHGCVFLN